jgi:hypothetical protein
MGPLHAPGARLNHPDNLDGVRRAGLLARAYGVEPEQAEEFVDVMAEEHAQQLGHVRDETGTGREPWVSFWRETDGEGRAAADEAWLREQRSALIAAIGGG